MLDNHIRIIKNDVKVSTNGKCVDICVLPDGQKGKQARTITVTLDRGTAVHLREALDAYLVLDKTM
ncbi:MAG: hypothetical protein IJ418_12065 [Clostridia bacterium]|nr:hypothetical protein [Clostridia bacterium]